MSVIPFKSYTLLKLYWLQIMKVDSLIKGINLRVQRLMKYRNERQFNKGD
jgi:hypothetical protein